MKSNIIVSVSFKNSDSDMEVYKFLSKHSSISGYIKDLIKHQMEIEKENEKNGKR